MPAKTATPATTTETPVAETPVKKVRTGRKRLTPAQYAAVQQLRQARIAMKAMKALEDDAKAVLFAGMGDKHLGTWEGVDVVRIGDRTWTGNDSSILRDAFPEAYEASYRESPYSVVDVI